MSTAGTGTGTEKFTIIFAPLNAWGHINACIAIGSILINKYGHYIIFIINQSWKGRLSLLGFEEEIYGDENKLSIPSEDWTNLVIKSKSNIQHSSLEKIKTFGLQAQENMVNEIMKYNDEIKQIIQRIKPNLIVVDNYILAPAFLSENIPWVRLRSANPIEINQFNVPPQNSGYSIENGDVLEWNHFTKIQNEIYKPLWEKYSNWFTKHCNTVLPMNQFILNSSYLNLYIYPKEIDYIDRRPMPDKWFRIDALVTEVKKTFHLPNNLYNFSTEKIIYLSLGTFGSADLNLMTRIVDFLAQTSYRIIVSKGPFHEKYTLPDNMWGEASLPQTEILPIVDGVICHGGNSTTNECFYFGKPMIILPILGDEYDNAQRINEKGYGVRLDPYNLTFEQLSLALKLILEDENIILKMKQASIRIQNSNGSLKAGELIMSILKP